MSSDEQVHWEVYYDEDGSAYYYNPSTEETTWDKPEGNNVIITDPNLMEEEVDHGSVAEEEGTATSPDEAADVAGQGGVMKDASGQVQIRQEQEELLQDQVGVDTEEKKYEEMMQVEDEEVKEKDSDGGSNHQIDNIAEEVDDDDQGKVEDDEETKIRKIKTVLKKPDAILDEDCFSNVRSLIQLMGAKDGSKEAIGSLVDGYSASTNVCGILSSFINLLEGKATSKTNNARSEKPRATDQSHSTKKIVEDFIKKMVRDNYTKKRGDDILNLSKAQAGFLDEMMKSVEWRRLLIELSAKFKDSTLLSYCLQSISKRGYHREITKLINPSDHFDLFQTSLISELVSLGKIAVSGEDRSFLNSDYVNDQAILDSLTETCSSNESTYLFTVEVLNKLIEISEAKEVDDGKTRYCMLQKFIHFKECLERRMFGDSSKNTLVKKRKVDFLLAANEHNRKHSRNGNTRKLLEISTDNLPELVQYSVSNLVRRDSLGLQVDSRDVERISELVATHGEALRLCLLSQPQVVLTLVGCLFKPGSCRIRQLEVKEKAASLLALYALNSTRNGESESDRRKGFTAEILKASQLCEELENTVSFIVLVDAKADENTAGGKLSYLVRKSCLISQCVLQWEMELVNNPEYKTSAAYLSLSHSLMSLARIIAVSHKFARPNVLSFSFHFLENSVVSREISYQQAQDLKQQCVRLLLWLCTKGLANEVLEKLSAVVQSTSSSVDAALIRFFVGGLLQIIKPPIKSESFAKKICAFLASSSCRDALTAPQFQSQKNKLTSLFEILQVDEVKELNSIYL